ncbi:MAG TPA: hypothetical protein PLI09_05495 [Candidatus Hydrogenedentes bacterium]|nr:hypothetical protein [Candidatus Hydrogenedentota bacterium]
MKTRSLLLYVPGLPLRIESFLPQRRLASVASALLSKGHITTILDYGTIESIRRSTPPGLTTLAQQASQAYEGKPSRFLPGFLTGYFQTRGFEVLLNEFLEGRQREIGSAITACQPLDFVGFLVLDRSDLREAISASERLRERMPDVKQFVYGPYIDMFSSLILSVEEAFDCACMGDVEIALPHWAECLHSPEQWNGLPNLVFRNGQQIVATQCDMSTTLDRFPEPCYEKDVYPAAHDMGKFKVFSVEQSRACASAPLHDSESRLSTRLVRMRSSAVLCNEMLSLDKQFGARAFHIEGKTTPAPHVEQLARDLKTRGLAVQYSRESHIRHLAPSSLPLLASSGCSSAGFQIDTGSQRLLEDFYGHEFGVTDVERMLEACRKAGIFTVADLTYPCPQDDYHTRAETLRLLSRCHPSAVRLSMPVLTPGSTWMNSAPQFGFKVDHAEYSRWALGHDSTPAWGEYRPPDVPYRMSGWTRSRISSEYAALLRDIEEEHIIIRATEREGLMARLSGYDGEEGMYCAMLQRRLFAADARGLMKLAGEFNGRATAPLNLVAFRPFTPVLAAVGN